MIVTKGVRLKRLFDIVNGATPSPEPVNWNGDVAWATPVDIGRHDGGFLEFTERLISRAGLSSCAAEIVPPGSLLLSTRAPIGYVAESKEQMSINQGCRALVPKAKVYSVFYRYVLSAIRPGLQALGRGSTFLELSTDELGDVQLPAPPVYQQRAVVRFLDKETERIDSLIAKKRQLVDHVDALVRAMMEQVFPVDAPRLSLRQCVTRFVDYRGATPTKAADGIPLITAATVKQGRLDFARSRDYVSPEAYEEWMRRGFPSPGDVIITTEAPLGEVAQIEDVPVALAQRVLLLKPNERVLPEYLKVYLLSPQARQELNRRATGSTAIGIKASHLKSLPIAVPPLDVQRDVVELVGSLHERYEQSRVLISSAVGKLEEYRGALITAAVTGQIDVRSAA